MDVDATMLKPFPRAPWRPPDSGAFSLPPGPMMMQALEVWREVGLPEFTIPKRALLRIERS